MDRLQQPNRFLSQAESDARMAEAIAHYIRHEEDGPLALSPGITSASGRPTLVVPLDYLPHRLPANNLNGTLAFAEIQDHAKIQEEIARLALPDEKVFWDKWDFMQSGKLCTVNSSVLRTNRPTDLILPASMSGDYYTIGGVIATPQRTWSDRDVWSRISGLPERDLENVPSGKIAKAYNAGHELGHHFQLCPTALIETDSYQSETEDDADEKCFAGLSLLAGQPSFGALARELETTIAGVVHGRALSGFRSAYRKYMTALRLDGHSDITYDKSVLSTYELRLRVYSDLKKVPLDKSSEKIQAMISRWWSNKDPRSQEWKNIEGAFGDQGDWYKYSPVNKSIPVLHRILESGDIDDKIGIRNAQLVIDAAAFFIPSLKSALDAKPVERMLWRPRPTGPARILQHAAE